MAERFKEGFCGCSLDGIAGSIPAGGMDVCLCCQIEVAATGRSLVQRSGCVTVI